jgi:Tol biopolymer transport system component
MHYPAAHPPTWITEEDFPNVIVFKETMESWVWPSDSVSNPTAVPVSDIDSREILFSVYPNGDIGIMNSDGSNLQILLDTPPNLAINDNRHASWLPNGNGISYTVDDFSGNAEIWIMDSQGDNPQLLLEDVLTDSTHAWSPDGRKIAYVSRNHQIMLFDRVSQTLTPLTDGSFRSEDDPDWSSNGSMIAFSAREGGNQDIYVINSDGSDLARVTIHPGTDQHPDWSTDGTKIVFSSTRDDDRIKDIFVIDLTQGMEEDGNTPVQITFDDTLDIDPDWSTDGGRIVYAAHDFGAAHATFFIMDVNGRNQTQLTRENTYHSPQWRP